MKHDRTAFDAPGLADVIHKIRHYSVETLMRSPDLAYATADRKCKNNWEHSTRAETNKERETSKDQLSIIKNISDMKHMAVPTREKQNLKKIKEFFVSFGLKRM